MTQPEALRLAELLQSCPLTVGDAQQAVAAVELRRLYAVNQELLGALKELKHVMPIFPKGGENLIGYKERYNAAQYQASEAIAKAEGKT